MKSISTKVDEHISQICDVLSLVAPQKSIVDDPNFKWIDDIYFPAIFDDILYFHSKFSQTGRNENKKTQMRSSCL